MSWGYQLKSNSVGIEEFESGFGSPGEAERACAERINELICENDIEYETPDEFEWDVMEDD